MLPSSHATAPVAPLEWDDDTPLEHDTRGLGLSPSHWSLPAGEVEKMDRLERGETLTLSPRVEGCLDRVAEVDPDLPDHEFNLAFLPSRERTRPSDEEVAAMIAEVPLCLLSGRQRQQALALRQHGVLESEATAHVFDPAASRVRLFIASMYALHAARGDAGAPWAKALAKLARWETDASSELDAEARASGGRALREAVKDRTQSSLHLEGQGLTRQLASQFSLPPPALIAELNLGSRLIHADLNRARPLDLDSFRDAVGVLNMSHWEVRLNDDRDVSLSLFPTHAEDVALRGTPARCGGLAVALAGEPGRNLRTVRIHPRGLAARAALPEPPSGWHIDLSARSWALSRTVSPKARDPVSVLAAWGATDPTTLWTTMGADRNGGILVDFLAESSAQLAGLSPLHADIVRQEMTARSRSLLEMLAAEPALLSELSDDLAGPWTCIDAKRKTLASMDQMLRAGSDPGALLRMSLHRLADHHVGIHDPGRENVQHAFALQALLDLRLAQITGTTFIRIGVPYFASASGMNNKALGREPTLADWPDSQHKEVEQILGNEVRGDFPMLREFMQAKSGVAHRAVEKLRLDPSYQQADAEWREKFLEAGNRADDDPSDVEAAQRYEEIQAQMPLEQERSTFALMDPWLDPLRKAYPASPTS